MPNTTKASSEAQEVRRQAKARKRADAKARHNTRKAQRTERDRKLKVAFQEFAAKRKEIWDWWNNLKPEKSAQ
jgi:hypothetical protein